jgi:hypothetical protein
MGISREASESEPDSKDRELSDGPSNASSSAKTERNQRNQVEAGGSVYVIWLRDCWTWVKTKLASFWEALENI